MITRGDAIANTHPNVITIRGDKGYDSSDNEVSLNESAIATETARLQAEYDSQEYARNRAAAYASTGDQLDMQYWDSVNDTTTWKDHIASVKAQFPKV